MTEMPVIPRPWAQRANDFRLRVAPFLVFFLALGVTVWLWDKNWGATTFVGEVQGSQATVASAQPGYLAEVLVEQFLPVRRGDVVAVVRPTSNSALNAALAAIRSDLEVMRVRMTLDQQRNNQNYQQLRFDWLDQRVQLAVARANLQFAESELNRVERLRGEGVTSQSEYELVRDRRNALQVEVEERSGLVAEMAVALQTMAPAERAEEDPAILRVVTAAIEAQETQLEQNEGALRLRAPIDGIVTSVARRPDEAVMAGETLIEISGAKPERIIGFIRQPINVQPKKGDVVEVRTRGNNRQVGLAQITAVGARMELFTQPLRIRGFDSSMERGLPVLVEVPIEMRLYPGELVDLFMTSSN